MPENRQDTWRRETYGRPSRLGGPRHRSLRGQGSMQPVAVVTGASSGIGAATAAGLAGAGYHVVLAARRAGRLAEVATRITDQGGSAQTSILDVNDRSAVAAFAGDLGRCDVLVNNAGGALGTEEVAKADPADWRWMFETNVLGTL